MERLLEEITDGTRRVSDLTKEETVLLCAQIREFLIEKVTQTGGHLASNLGTVELTVALHSVFDFSKDSLIFDVGHQCYTHKLLTGRRDGFDSLRTLGGLSGFPKREESVFDAFGTGHSSTSLSAAVGFAEAKKIAGSDSYTVAVVGDGAFTGGMIHEALNNCRPDLRLILILNENEMSISPNIGAFARQIAKIRSSRRYYVTKNRTVRAILHIPLIGLPLFRLIRKIKQGMKNILYHSNYFEELGFYYLGPVDGNDAEKVRTLLLEAKNYGRSAVIHIKTKKGRGYAPAEENPSAYHSISPAGKSKEGKNYSALAGEILCDMAKEHSDLCAVTAAMTEGVGLSEFEKNFPNRFFDVGIAEEHAATFSAGLCAAGFRPFFAVYSSFLQRAYDNLIHDVALQKLPLALLVDRAGLNAGDGATHHGVFDVSFLSGIPGVTVFAPNSEFSLRKAMEYAYDSQSFCAVRYENAVPDSEVMKGFTEPETLSPCADYLPTDPKKVILITYGRLLSEVKKAEEKLGVECGCILVRQLTPYEKVAEEIAALLPENCAVLVCEEGIEKGGFGMNLLSALGRIGALVQKRADFLAVTDPFTARKGAKNVFEAYGIDAETIVKCAEDLMKRG